MVERFQSGPHGPAALVSFVLSTKAAAGQGIHLEVVRLPEARKGCAPAALLGQGQVTIDYVYDPLYRLTEANYSDGQYFHYTHRLRSEQALRRGGQPPDPADAAGRRILSGGEAEVEGRAV